MNEGMSGQGKKKCLALSKGQCSKKSMHKIQCHISEGKTTIQKSQLEGFQSISHVSCGRHHTAVIAERELYVFGLANYKSYCVEGVKVDIDKMQLSSDSNSNSVNSTTEASRGVLNGDYSNT